MRTLPTEPRLWQLAHGRAIELGRRACLMGIVNATPDSFSDGGRFRDVDEAVSAALEMVRAGAAIIDVGGESTRPDAVPVTPLEEQRRVLPIIEALAGQSRCIVSIDTYRAETAKLAIAAGAHIINDVWGAQKDSAMARCAAETGAGLCLMHNGRDRSRLADVIDDQIAYLRRSIAIAREAGVADSAIVIDPGFGFAKNASENFRVLGRLHELTVLGYPIMVGASRKRFIRAALAGEDARADIGTAATSALLRERGAAIFRVHDVAANRDALAIADAMLSAMSDTPPGESPP